MLSKEAIVQQMIDLEREADRRYVQQFPADERIAMLDQDEMREYKKLGRMLEKHN